MLVYDFEVFKHNWLICWLDTTTRKKYKIWDSKELFEKFYNHYKKEVWVGYNSRNYDQWVAKAILCGFNPYEISQWIIVKEEKGFAFSKLLNNYPIINYDCAPPFHSLKQLEAFLGHDIKETPISFDIDRPLTESEKLEVEKYCFHDVQETFEIFVRTKNEWESHVGLVKEFKLPITYLSKTKAQLSAEILVAMKRNWNDEFDIKFPDTLDLGKYSFLKDRYEDWSKNIQDYDELSFKQNICGVEHTFGIGGLHGAITNYYGDGLFIMADVGSFYPAIMIEYGFLSRNVTNPDKYRQIRDERIIMKHNKDPRQEPRKIVLNSTFGASKDKYNKLYDPQMANNVCIAGQLLLVDLIDKLEGHCQLVQSNTDGILIKLYNKDDRDKIMSICEQWCKRTRMTLEYDEYVKVIQADVNNYIIVDENGKYKSKGRIAKKQKDLDYDLPILNECVINHFVHGKSVQETVMNCNDLIKFQKIFKIGSNYDYCVHNGNILNEKVNRVFASICNTDTALFKKHQDKTTLDKLPDVPEHCFIINENILEKEIPKTLDKQWYIEYISKKINAFI